MSSPKSLILLPALLMLTACSIGLGADRTVTDGRGASEVNKSLSVPPGATAGGLSTVNGEIRIGAGARAGDVETVNGTISLGDQATVGDVETVNGSVRGGADVQIAGDLEAVNGSLRFGPGLRLAGEASTVNGSIEASQCEIGKDVETVNGSLRFEACQLRGDLELVNGRVELSGNTVLAGDLTVRKPKGTGWGQQKNPVVIIGAGVEVRGRIVLEREVDLRIDPAARVGQVIGP